MKDSVLATNVVGTIVVEYLYALLPSLSCTRVCNTCINIQPTYIRHLGWVKGERLYEYKGVKGERLYEYKGVQCVL